MAQTTFERARRAIPIQTHTELMSQETTQQTGENLSRGKGSRYSGLGELLRHHWLRPDLSPSQFYAWPLAAIGGVIVGYAVADLPSVGDICFPKSVPHWYGERPLDRSNLHTGGRNHLQRFPSLTLLRGSRSDSS